MTTDIQEAKRILHNAGVKEVGAIYMFLYPQDRPREGGRWYRFENVMAGKVRDKVIEERVCDMADDLLKRMQ